MPGKAQASRSAGAPIGILLAATGAALALAGLARALREWIFAPRDGWVPASGAWPWLAAAGGTVLAAAGIALYLRGLARGRSTPATFLSPEEEREVMEAIAAAERRTSGEIRVHLAAGGEGEIMERAARTFEQLGMTATRERNGVLFYVDVPARRIAILGDAGIHERVPEGFWDEVLSRVRERFAEGRFGKGLAEGIALAGEALAEHFPHRPDDVNELPDQISRES